MTSGPTLFFCGDVEGSAAGSEPGTVLGSDRHQIGCVSLQARDQSSGGADNPHSPRVTRVRSVLPKQNLGTKTSRLRKNENACGVMYIITRYWS